MDDFNSSDVEFEPDAEPEWTMSVGQKSIEQLLANSTSDRLSSKKTVKQLRFEHGAPMTQRAMRLWINRFEAFRKDTLRQSVDEAFKGDDLIRFFDAILNLKLTRIPGKPGPNASYIWGASFNLIQYGFFTWPEFTYPKGTYVRLKSFIDQAISKKRLTRGSWHQTAWIGFVTLSRMVRAYLDRANENGVRSWDSTLIECLFVVLISSLGARSGDVTLSKGYTECFMRFEHFVLYLAEDDTGGQDHAALFRNVKATVSIAFEKGKKNMKEDNRTKYLSPILDPSAHHMCPISLLLIHALRHGLVKGGSTLAGVLAHAAARPDKQIQWTHPKRPILCSFRTQMHAANLDKPANTDQVRKVVKRMAKASGLLDRVTTHSLRSGAARDTARLPADSYGITTKAFGVSDVGRLMGHDGTASAGDITHRYIGDTPDDIYAARAAARIVHRREPAFAAAPQDLAIIDRPVTREDRLAFVGSGPTDVSHSDVDMGRSNLKVYNRLQYRIRRKIETEVRDTAMAEPRRVKTPHSSTYLPSPMPAPSAVPIPPQFRKPLAEIAINTSTGSRHGAGTHHSTSQKDPDVHVVDRLSDETTTPQSPSQSDNEDVMVDTLQDILFGAPAHTKISDWLDPALADDYDAEEDEEFAFLDEQPLEVSNADPVDPNGSAGLFISSYSRINSVNVKAFADKYRRWKPGVEDEAAAAVRSFSDSGNSRDEPTPFVHCCKVCPYTTPFPWFMDTHEASRCLKKPTPESELRVESFTEQTNDSIDTWWERPCTILGCPDETVFQLQDTFVRHLMTEHDFERQNATYRIRKNLDLNVATQRREPNTKPVHVKSYTARPCTILGCPDETVFEFQLSLVQHLVTEHGFERHDAVYRVSSKMDLNVATKKRDPSVKSYTARPCTILGCPDETVFEFQPSLVQHLVTEHGLERHDAAYRITNKMDLNVATKKRDPIRGPIKRKGSVSNNDDQLSDPPTKKPRIYKKRGPYKPRVKAPKNDSPLGDPPTKKRGAHKPLDGASNNDDSHGAPV